MHKKKVLLNKPIYLGFCILDLSKYLMYDFHYNTIKKEYGERAKLLFQDTDSLTYSIKTQDIYEDMLKRKDLLVNKKVLGKFKDEMLSLPIREFIGLRSKMYSCDVETDDPKKASKKTAKGIKTAVKDKHISHEDYKKVLETMDRTYDTQNTIRSYNHEVFSISVNKVGLSAFDDKRWLLDDGFRSYAYGHRQIVETLQGDPDE